MNKREEEKLRKQQEKLEKELARMKQMSIYEEEYSMCEYICGIDEVGRGPLAGPVVAAAVILPKDQEILYLNDSKKLSEKKREMLYGEIMERLEAYSESQLIESYTKLTVIDMSKKVLEHLAKKYSNVREGVRTVMGGKILDYPAKDAWRKAHAEGHAEGITDHLTMLVKKKLEKGLPVEEIAEALEEDVSVIEEIIAGLEKELEK